MTVLGEGRQPDRSHCLALAGQCGIKPREAAAVIDEVNSAIDQWPSFADQAGCKRKVTTDIGATIGPI